MSRALHPIVVVAVYGHQNAALLNAALKALRLVLRNAHPCQTANDPADGSRGAYARQRGHNGTGRNQRAQAGIASAPMPVSQPSTPPEIHRR